MQREGSVSDRNKNGGTSCSRKRARQLTDPRLSLNLRAAVHLHNAGPAGDWF